MIIITFNFTYLINNMINLFNIVSVCTLFLQDSLVITFLIF